MRCGLLATLAALCVAAPAATLSGHQPRPPSVVFILDCSGSMRSKIETGIPGQVRSRMEAARSALVTVLGELARQDESTRPRVGMWFYGHRLAWKNATQPLLIVNRNAAGGRIPNGLAPAEDVEHIMPLGNFGPMEYGVVSDRLKRVEPYGLTPVNLAILRVLEQDLGKKDDEVSKSIIVINDGWNNQRHPVGPEFKSVTPTRTEAVIRAWDRVKKPIPVHFVRFGYRWDDPQRELKKIADHTNGDWSLINSEEGLVQQLRKLLDMPF